MQIGIGDFGWRIGCRIRKRCRAILHLLRKNDDVSWPHEPEIGEGWRSTNLELLDGARLWRKADFYPVEPTRIGSIRLCIPLFLYLLQGFGSGTVQLELENLDVPVCLNDAFPPPIRGIRSFWIDWRQQGQHSFMGNTPLAVHAPNRRSLKAKPKRNLAPFGAPSTKCVVLVVVINLPHGNVIGRARAESPKGT